MALVPAEPGTARLCALRSLAKDRTATAFRPRYPACFIVYFIEGPHLISDSISSRSTNARGAENLRVIETRRLLPALAGSLVIISTRRPFPASSHAQRTFSITPASACVLYPRIFTDGSRTAMPSVLLLPHTPHI